MKSLLILAVIAQFQMPPAPPAPPTGGTALESELSRTAEIYRRQCYFEKAIKIIVDTIRLSRMTARPDLAIDRIKNKELADAANADPFDRNRVVLAMRARAKAQAQTDAISIASETDKNIAILEKLPIADQVLFARSNSGASRIIPLKSCS